MFNCSLNYSSMHASICYQMYDAKKRDIYYRCISFNSVLTAIQSNVDSERILVFPQDNLDAIKSVCYPKFGASGSEYKLLVKTGKTCYTLISLKDGSLYEPRCEKTGLRGFRPGPTQTEDG